mgnify:CR=1 FL=1
MIRSKNWSGLHEYLNELSDDMLEYNFSYLDWKSYAGYDLKTKKEKGCTEIKNTVMQIDTESFRHSLLQTGRSYHFSEIYWIMRWKPVKKSVIKSVG